MLHNQSINQWRDVICLFARVLIFVFDWATQEVPMKKIFNRNCQSSFWDTGIRYWIVRLDVYWRGMTSLTRTLHLYLAYIDLPGVCIDVSSIWQHCELGQARARGYKTKHCHTATHTKCVQIADHGFSLLFTLCHKYVAPNRNITYWILLHVTYIYKKNYHYQNIKRQNLRKDQVKASIRI